MNRDPFVGISPLYQPGHIIPEDPNHWEVRAGVDIKGTIKEAIAIASLRQHNQTFEFNGVKVEVAWDSNYAKILRDWYRAMAGAIEGPVGPHPKPELSEEEIANDIRLHDERKAKQAAAAAARAEAQRIEEERVDAIVAATNPIELKDAERWAATVKKNKDFYGKGVMDYAERWARMMQKEIAAGKSVAEAAKATENEADTGGITGFMFGCARDILGACWIHGDELLDAVKAPVTTIVIGGLEHDGMTKATLPEGE